MSCKMDMIDLSRTTHGDQSMIRTINIYAPTDRDSGRNVERAEKFKSSCQDWLSVALNEHAESTLRNACLASLMEFI